MIEGGGNGRWKPGDVRKDVSVNVNGNGGGNVNGSVFLGGEYSLVGIDLG